MTANEAFVKAYNGRGAFGVYKINDCLAVAPDVVAFTKHVAGAMEYVERVYGHEKAQEYLTSYRVAAGLLYGKQLEYMDQLLFLEQEANQIKNAQSRKQNAGYRDYKESPDYDYAESQKREAPRGSEYTYKGQDYSDARAGNKSKGSASEQDARYQPPQPPREERAKPSEVGGFSSGGEVKKRKTGENSYENNDSGIGGVVSYIRSMHQVPIVIEGRTGYRVYQIPGTPEYLAKLKSNTAFAQSQVQAVAKAMKERVLEPDPENGSKRSPTSKFHLRMQGLFHPDSMNRYSDNSAPIEREKDILAELFKTYQGIVATNPSTEFYGLA